MRRGPWGGGVRPGRRTPFVATLVLTGALALGCGDEDPERTAPDTALQDYCAAYQEFFDERRKQQTAAQQGEQVDDSDVVATLKAWGQDLRSLEVPEEMPDKARKGHDTWVELIGQIDAGADQADVVALEAQLSKVEMARVQAFTVWNDRTCLGSGEPGQPSSPGSSGSTSGD